MNGTKMKTAKIEEQKTKNDEGIRAAESLVEELKAAKLATENSKAAFYISAGLDPEEAKNKLDLSPKEVRDKIATLKGPKLREAQRHWNSFQALFEEDQMSDEEAEDGEEAASDDGLSEGEGTPDMDLEDLFGNEPPPSHGKNAEGKELFTKEQIIEEWRKKKVEERKAAAYVTPEKKKKISNKKGLLSPRFVKGAPNSSQKPKVASTPNATELAASGGLGVTS